MEIFEMLSPDFRHSDERGELVQLVQEGFVQFNVLKTHKDVYRGGHYHSFTREAFYVIEGCVEVVLSGMGTTRKHIFNSGEFFLIPSGITHQLYFPEECIMVAMYDKPVVGSDGKKDIHVVEG